LKDTIAWWVPKALGLKPRQAVSIEACSPVPSSAAFPLRCCMVGFDASSLQSTRQSFPADHIMPWFAFSMRLAACLKRTSTQAISRNLRATKAWFFWISRWGRGRGFPCLLACTETNGVAGTCQSAASRTLAQSRPTRLRFTIH